MSEEWLQAGGLRARHAGPPAPRGLPLALLHGMGGGAWVWERMQAWLAERGRSSYALELPGHGLAAGESVMQYTLADYVKLTAEALAALPNAYLIGHSMGGLIAQGVAAIRPAPGNVFMCSAPPWHMFRPAYKRMWGMAMQRPDWLLRGALGQPILWPDRMQAALLEKYLTPEWRTVARARTVPESGLAVRDMAFGLGVNTRRRLDSPCAVLAATDDRMLPSGEQKRLAQYYNCELEFLPGGHMLPLERGGEAAAAWLDVWCSKIEKTKT